MGLGLAFIAISVAVTLASAAYAIIQARKGNAEALGANIDDFNPTLVKEGVVVPVIYGRVRTRGNLIHWGNLVNVPIKQKGGGKGGGGGSTVTGFQVFADVWQTIGMGKLTLIDTILDDKIQTIQASSFDYNDGTSTTIPTFTADGTLLEFQSHLNPVAHAAIKRMFLGENATTIPTIEFIVERDLSYLPLTNANMANGNNPAAVIMDMLILAGKQLADFNLTSFTEADTYFFNKGYALNLKFDSRGSLDEAIDEVLGYVDMTTFRDNLGRIGVRALSENDTFSESITKEDITKFSMSRPTWSQVPNEFVATFTSESDNFKTATVKTINPAAAMLAGSIISSTRDLKAYRDASTASKRITEIMKRESYPQAQFKIETSEKYSLMLPGDILRLSHDDYNIVSTDIRLTQVDISELETNKVNLQGVQHSESLFDDVFKIAGGGEFSTIKQDFTLVEAPFVKIFELPYLNEFSDKYLMLVERSGFFETGYLVQTSPTISGDYTTTLESTTFSLRGTLNAAYNGDGTAIDDTVGFEITFTKFDPEFDSIDRAEQLFTEQRFAIIGDEIMSFATVTITSPTSLRLDGIVRGVFNTPIQSHSVSAEVWLTTFEDNILNNLAFSDFFVKVLPQFINDTLSPGLATAINVTSTGKVLEPREVSLIKATKTGGNVLVELFPNVVGIPGAGDLNVAEPYGDRPFNIGGATFEISGNFTTQTIAADSVTVTPGAFPEIITVKTIQNNRVTTGITVNVGTLDGVYKGA